MWTERPQSPVNLISQEQKMPVKIEHSNCYSPTTFDCNSMFFNDLDELADEINISNFDDLWNNFIPTPPQSPNFKFETRLEDGFEDNTDFEQKLIHHDCMWSGQCSEGVCNSMYNKPTTSSIQESSLLSTSPINSFQYIPSYDNELLNCFMEETVGDEPQMDRNAYAMANDHSYESTSLIAPKDIKQEVKEEIEDEIVERKSSLIRKPITAKIVNQGKITKIKCKKGGSKKSESSILNFNATRNSKSQTSVLKPTIISVSNFKELSDSSMQAKYKVSIKKKRISLVDKNNEQNQMQHISNANQISSLISPNCSDSEESSLSFSSVDESRKASPPFRRREHNDSERKRRDHLRNSFNNLKDQVPKLKSSEKRPPRIMILHEATTYVNQLIDTNCNLENTLKEQMAKKQRLLSILNSLKNKQNN